MSPKDIRRRIWDQLRERDLRVFAHLLPTELILEAARLAGVPARAGVFNVLNMAWLAVASALRTFESFTAVLDYTIKLIEDGPHFDNSIAQRARRSAAPTAPRRRGDPRPSDPSKVSEEAFVQARQLLPWGFWAALILLLTRRFEAEHGDKLRFGRFRLLALDGTCLDLPDHAPLRQHFGTVSNGKGRRRAQARLVMLQLPSVRLPWRYELTPITEGERTVAARLLGDLRGDDLVLMDRGFFSYGLFWQVIQGGAHFAVRAVNGVKFETVATLADGSRLVDWTPSDRRWRKAGLPETIRLRAIDYQMKGFRPSTIITSVTDPEEIGREQWVGMALVDETGRVLRGPGLYHRRWEIETTYAELKEIQGMERGLRGRTPETITFEVAGHIVLYLLVRWLMVKAAEEAGVEALRLSFSGAMEELKTILPSLVKAGAGRAEGVLLPRLLKRMASHRVPLRPGRNYPRPHDTKVKNKGKGKKQQPSKLPPTEAAA